MSNATLKTSVLIATEEVKTAIKELPEVKTDLATIKTNLMNADENLEATWIGTAKDSYVAATDFAQKQLGRIRTGIGGIYDETFNICGDRNTIDQDAATAASGNQSKG